MAPAGSPIFAHGVASGDPLTDRVVLWTRISGADVPTEVEWTVARDEQLRDVVGSGTVETVAEQDWTVHVDADGLEPDTTYYYGFRVGGDGSPIARTRTLPEHTEHLRFAMVSCAKFNAGYFNAYSCIAERDDLQFLLHLGDYIYEMSNTPPKTQTAGADIGRPFDPLTECVTLEDYRTRYSQYHLDPDVQRLHLRYPIIPTMDDHELADGAWRDGSTEHKPEYGPWADRKAAAFQVREEWLPIRRPDPTDPTRVFRSVPLGGLAELFITDTRSRRDEPLPEPGMSAAGRSAWGPEQRAWLFEGLARSTATWRLLGNPSVMSPIYRSDLPEHLSRAFLKLKLVAEDGSGADYDQWDGYPDERDALFRFVRERGFDNLVVLSGDVHVSIASELHADPFRTVDDEAVAVEFVTPSLTSQNLDDKMGWPRHDKQSRAAEAAALEYLPHWLWVDMDSHGYVVIDVTPERVTAEWWHLETVLERSTAEERASAWAVDHGSSTPVRLS